MLRRSMAKLIKPRHEEKQYLRILSDIMKKGEDKPNRTGIDTRMLFHREMRYDLRKGFPMLTTKKVPFHLVVAELLWFLRGSSDVRELQKLGCKIWDDNAGSDYWQNRKKELGFADDEGYIGRIYGVQWRDWQSPDGSRVDQLAQVIDDIKNSPFGRRKVVTAWNPGEIDEMALPPCHMIFQFNVSADKEYLDLSMKQRSCDMFLGVPFNISSYALLLSMVAHVTGLKPREFVHTLEDAHIYHNHFEQAKTQLARTPYKFPKLWLNLDIKDIDDFHRVAYGAVDKGETPKEAIAKVARLENYEAHPHIKAEMAV